MIDLHLHLDGSIGILDYIHMSDKYGIELGDNFPLNAFVNEHCRSLGEYLEKFELPTRFLQTREALEYVTRALVVRLYQMGYIYAEIRFAPCLHTQAGLKQTEVVETVLQGLQNGLDKCPGFEANLILCCMRHVSETVNLETIEVAKKFKGTRVVAVDLAGDEVLHPCSYYKKIFDLAKKYELNITIHAGEATGSDEIMMALDNGATRIGHGVHLSLDKETINRVKENNICFEFCPTSNLQTKSLPSYKDVPLLQFLENEIPVTINSDNMTVSSTDAISEMKKMVETFNLSKKDVKALLTNSINHSFTSEEVKKKLKEKLASKIDEYYEFLIK